MPMMPFSVWGRMSMMLFRVWGRMSMTLCRVCLGQMSMLFNLGLGVKCL